MKEFKKEKNKIIKRKIFGVSIIVLIISLFILLVMLVKPIIFKVDFENEFRSGGLPIEWYDYYGNQRYEFPGE